MVGQWVNFLVAEVGTAAGLTGLVFVGLSINLARIIASPALVDRAAEALLMLVQPVALGLSLLAPNGHVAAGVVVTAESAIFAVVLGWLLARTRPTDDSALRRQYLVRTVLVTASVGAELLGAVLLAAGVSDSLSFIGFGTMACIGVGISDAWVLLIEILR